MNLGRGGLGSGMGGGTGAQEEAEDVTMGASLARFVGNKPLKYFIRIL